MKRLGVVGYPVSHSISPSFQQAALDGLGIEARYELYEVRPAELPTFVEGIRRAEWLGVNITIPHKEAVIPLLDDLSPEARAIGAVNTIAKRGNLLYGYNTDVVGFLRALEAAGFEVAGTRAVVLGAGGAARAVTTALCHRGAREIVIAGRSWERTLAVVEEHRDRHPGVRLRRMLLDGYGLATTIRDSRLLINTTPVGMTGGSAERQSPVASAALHPGLVVFDAVYAPLQTPLLRMAREAGARAISGLDMLLFQGAEAFELWTGLPAPVDIMATKAKEALER